MGILYKKSEKKTQVPTPAVPVTPAVPATPMKSETVDKFGKFGVTVKKFQ